MIGDSQPVPVTKPAHSSVHQWRPLFDFQSLPVVYLLRTEDRDKSLSLSEAHSRAQLKFYQYQICLVVDPDPPITAQTISISELASRMLEKNRKCY